MFLYEKKIIYLSRYRNGEREEAAGFIKAVREKDAYTLDIHIRSEYKDVNGYYTLLIIAGGKETVWQKIVLNEGKAAVHSQIKIQNEMLCIGQETYKENELLGIKLWIDNQNWIGGKFREQENEAESAEIIEAAENVKIPEEEISLHAADRQCPVFETPVFEDKWEQLQQNYQTVHPFGDERIFLTIEPKDFVILQASFQKLVNNSFLLHGFYNYRHLILGPDKELGGEGNFRFYLGVPGTYFEREKMVAVMFGFEGFECAGAVETGKFGYYMRRVEL